MTIQAKLFIDGKSYVIRKFNYGFSQASDVFGQPRSKPRQTGLLVSIDAVKTNEFEEWAFSDFLMKNIEIHMIHFRKAQRKKRILKCFDCHLIQFDTQFYAYSNKPMTFNLFITCGGIKSSLSEKEFSELWRITPSTEVTLRTEKKEIVKKIKTQPKLG